MMIIDHIDLLSEGDFFCYKHIIPQFDYYWWLSSPGVNKLRACEVGFGVLVDRNVSIKTVNGVRPTLTIVGLDALPGDKINLFGYNWTVLNEHLVLCDSRIDDCIFDSYDNNWESSQLKGFLEAWLTQKIEETERYVAIKNKTEFLLLQKLCLNNDFNMLDYALYENIAKWGFENTRIRFSPYQEWRISFNFDTDCSFVEFCDYVNNNY